LKEKLFVEMETFSIEKGLYEIANLIDLIICRILQIALTSQIKQNASLSSMTEMEIIDILCQFCLPFHHSIRLSFSKF